MQYLMICRTTDEIISKVDLGDDVGVTGATTYFQGMKRMPDLENFNKLWRVMSQTNYDFHFKATLQNRQMGKMKYEWWKDIGEGGELDE